MVGGDIDRLLFGASGSELETSDCEKFRSGKIFGVEGSSEMGRSGGDSESWFKNSTIPVLTRLSRNRNSLPRSVTGPRVNILHCFA